MKEDYEVSYRADGVRFNWNVFPSTRLEASEMLTPIGCLYTPLHEREAGLKPVPVIDTGGQNPTSCSVCDNYINPHIQIDRTNRMWYCPFCQEKNFLSDDLKIPEINTSIDQWPVELQPSSSTVEYVLPSPVGDISANYQQLNYFFVIDLYQHIDEVQSSSGELSSFNALKSRIINAIEKFPENSRIGLVSFDQHVNFHCFDDMSTRVVTPQDIFSTDKESSTVNQLKQKAQLFNNKYNSFIDDIFKNLGLNTYQASDISTSSLNKYLMKVNLNNRSKITDYISQLKPSLTNSYKPFRSTGLALYLLSLALNKSSYRGFIGKVLVFLGGPCTNFPGNIIDLSLETNLRTHRDIANFNATQFIPSLKFYKTLALIASGLSPESANTIISSTAKKETDFPIDSNLPRWSFDLFSGSLDQVGIYEMKSLSLQTMGDIFLYDSFTHPRFEEQLNKLFCFDDAKYNSTLTVKTSSMLKVSRMIGHGHCLPSSYQAEKFYDLHHEKISDHLSQYDSSSKKTNFTNVWSFNLLDPNDTLALFFEPDLASSSTALDSEGIKEMFIQFQLKYWDKPTKCWKLRITNLCKKTTLAYLVANKVKMSDGSYKLHNTKSNIIKQKELFSSFDQHAFITLITRLLLDKIDTTLGYEEFDNIIRDFDKSLVRLLHNFGGISLKTSTNQNQNPFYSSLLDQLAESYQINDSFKDLPVLGYNLRKNPQLIKIFNSLPDETAFYHHWFMRMNCETSIKVIQPKLYELKKHSNGINSLPLDAEAVLRVSPQSFVIMDCGFNIIIYINELVLKLHHSNNRHLIYSHKFSKPIEHINRNVTGILVPNIIITQRNHSQARYLFARLDTKPISLEDDLSTLELNDKPSGFLSFFKSNNKNKKTNLLIDDMNLDSYYNGLMESVKLYKPSDDY